MAATAEPANIGQPATGQDAQHLRLLNVVHCIDDLAVNERVRVAASEGSAAVFDDLYRRYHVDVFRYAVVLTKSPDDAEDIASEAFARALFAWSRGREPEGPPLPWLLAIARNLATDRWRRARRAVQGIASRSSADGTAQIESMVWLQAISNVLPPRQREVVALRYYRDLGDGEIAKIMGLTESGVRSLVSRAIATLRAHPEVWR
jgi:RNA polymerase sigma-70 factor (ECF subfamily)